MCKSNGDETGDVDFLPWRTAYFGLTTGGASILESTELGTKSTFQVWEAPRLWPINVSYDLTDWIGQFAVRVHFSNH